MKLNEIYNMDCLDGLKQLESKSVDLVLTSPPYNLKIDYGKNKDDLGIKEYYEWCSEWIEECFRVLKDGGRFCLQMGAFNPSINEPGYNSFTNLFLSAGFIFREFVVWNKNQISKRTAWGSWMSPSNPRILPPFEMIINFHKGNPSLQHKGESDLTKKEFLAWTNGLWTIQPETQSEHPAPFPEELAKRCVKMNTYKEDVVLDPFMGSGTTALVCLKYQRNFIGFELNEDYCKMANKRIDVWRGQTRLF